MIERILPNVIIVIQACSAVPYFFMGDWRKGLYWVFATGLTLVVTY